MNRAEHLAWAKRRALELVDAGDVKQAAASMIVDLKDHPELVKSITLDDTRRALEVALSGNAAAARRWIEAFI